MQYSTSNIISLPHTVPHRLMLTLRHVLVCYWLLEGIYTYSTGDEVVGRWQNDVQDGLSVFKSADGSLREELWWDDGCLLVPSAPRTL